MRISDWGADVCSSDLRRELRPVAVEQCALGFRTDTIPVGQERPRAEGLPRRALIARRGEAHALDYRSGHGLLAFLVQRLHDRAKGRAAVTRAIHYGAEIGREHV